MNSAIKNLCAVANSTLSRYGYDPERLGYTEIEIQEMRRFIEVINTKEDLAREQIEVDIMRVVDNYQPKPFCVDKYCKNRDTEPPEAKHDDQRNLREYKVEGIDEKVYNNI